MTVSLCRRGPVPCSAVSPVHQNQVLLLGMLHAPSFSGWATFTYSPGICNGSLPVVGHLVPVLFMGQSGPVLGSNWVRLSICQRCNSTKCKAHSLFYPQRSSCFWARPVVRPSISPAHSLGHIWMMCVLMFPSPQSRSHFGVVLVLVETVCTVPGLLPLFLCKKL